MPADSPVSGRRPSGIASFVLRKKDPVQIVLDGQQDLTVPTYTTLERINGQVNIQFEKNTEFNKVAILFEGVANTFVEKTATPAPTSGRSVASHIFMRASQPIDNAHLPDDGVAKAGELYTVPFTFVVPERLLDNICRHRTDTRRDGHDPTKEEHILLPPSIGDSMVAAEGEKVLDDLAPEMAKIAYRIRVVIGKAREEQKDSQIVTKTAKLRIIPAKDEKPPLNVPKDSEDYSLRKEKNVKRGTFKLGKVGTIVAEAAQPRAFMLPPPNVKAEAPIASSTTINIRFDPSDPEAPPPSLRSLTTKLRVFTYYGTNPFRDVPNRNVITAWDVNRGAYSETVDISTRPLSATQWARHEPLEIDMSHRGISRTESTASVNPGLDPEAAASSNYQPSLPYYTAAILLPISLPHSTDPKKRKTFLPTFHYCLISRIYVLELTLSYNSPNKTVSTPAIQLRLPVQVGSRPDPEATPQISDEEMRAIQARFHEHQELSDAAEVFIPRRMTFVADGQEVTPEQMHRMRTRSEDLGDMQPETIPSYSESERQVRRNSGQQSSRRPSMPGLGEGLATVIEQSQQSGRSSANQGSSPTSVPALLPDTPSDTPHLRGGSGSMPVSHRATSSALNWSPHPLSNHRHILPNYIEPAASSTMNGHTLYPNQSPFPSTRDNNPFRAARIASSAPNGQSASASSSSPSPFSATTSVTSVTSATPLSSYTLETGGSGGEASNGSRAVDYNIPMSATQTRRVGNIYRTNFDSMDRGLWVFDEEGRNGGAGLVDSSCSRIYGQRGTWGATEIER